MHVSSLGRLKNRGKACLKEVHTSLKGFLKNLYLDVCAGYTVSVEEAERPKQQVLPAPCLHRRRALQMER